MHIQEDIVVDLPKQYEAHVKHRPHEHGCFMTFYGALLQGTHSGACDFCYISVYQVYTDVYKIFFFIKIWKNSGMLNWKLYVQMYSPEKHCFYGRKALYIKHPTDPVRKEVPKRGDSEHCKPERTSRSNRFPLKYYFVCIWLAPWAVGVIMYTQPLPLMR